jgi:glucan biosynthesis protein C
MTDSTGRIEYLDVMRATLMMLGVALHASLYSPNGPWLIQAEDRSTFFYLLSQTINAFRMPSFFFLSGFLSTMLLLRKGPRLFLRLRITRIAVPLLTTALTLNVLQTWILDSTHWIETGVADYFLNGVWVQHLWFLVNLLVYICILAFIATVHRTPIIKWLHTMLNRMPFWLMLVLLPLLSVFIVALSRLGIPVYANLLGFTTLITLFQYFPFFMVGCLAFANEALFEKFTTQRFPVLLLWVLLALTLRIWLSDKDSMLTAGLTIYLQCSINWLCICAFFSCFRLLVRRVTPFWQYLSDASYTGYLFHHVVVVCLGLVFIDLAIPAPIGFALIVSATLAITFSVHSLLISRYPTLALLFNGTKKPMNGSK